MKLRAKIFIEIILLILGLFSICVGFFIENSEKNPFILNVVAPEYISGINAFNELNNLNSCIEEKDNGFSVINKLIFKEFNINDSEIKIIKLCHKIDANTPLIAYTDQGIIEFLPLEITTDKGETAKLDGTFLKDSLEKIKEDSWFNFKIILLFLGIFLIIGSFYSNNFLKDKN